ncbi:MAG: hypothetical protein WCN95_14650 [bacterium]
MKRFLIPLMLLTLAVSVFADDGAVDPKKIYDKLDPAIYHRRGIDVEPGVTYVEGGIMFRGIAYDNTNGRAVLIATNEADIERLILLSSVQEGRKAPTLILLAPQPSEKATTNGTLPHLQSLSMSLDAAPLATVAKLYGDITGKKVVVDKDVSAALSFNARLVTLAEAATVVEDVLKDAGFVITPVGTNTVRISRKAGDK